VIDECFHWIRHDVTVLSKFKDFLFMPSLIRVPFGRRKREDITFALAPVFAEKGVAFKNVEVTRIDLRERFVEDTAGAKTPYDYLVIATGRRSRALRVSLQHGL
jgi:sulfide:quinone oxidoreductase